jgi:crotonobetaine/carnitine-CoA ligase
VLDPMGERTLNHLLAERVAERPDQVFLTYEDKDGGISDLSYRQFQERVDRVAAGLDRLAVRQKDFVVVHLTNSPEFLLSWFAFARLGVTLVPSNTANTARELEYIIGFSGARVVITEPAFLDTVEAGIEAAGVEAQVIVARGRAEGLVAFDDLAATGAAPPSPVVSSLDLAELIFTSGTTRKPKAVMLTHAHCLRAGLDSVHCLWLDEGERCLTALPMFHVNAQAMSLLGTLTVGGTLIMLEEFRATKFWTQVRAHGATQTCLVAMQLRTILAQPPAPDEQDHVVRRLFFAINVTDQEKDAFEARFGVSLINGYGLSEAMTLLTCSPIVGPRRWPSIGLASPGRRLLLVDDHGVEVPTGEVGEIVVEGTPGRDLLLGYYRDEEATAAALKGNRLHTGDNAYADAEGYLYFFDRKKDMIKRAGENVSAIEVEWAIIDHPGVVEASVVGIPDPIRDEAVAAVVVREDAELTGDDVIEWCRRRLSKFKVPTVVTFVDELPKTSIGKVRKDEVRKHLATRATESPA